MLRLAGLLPGLRLKAWGTYVLAVVFGSLGLGFQGDFMVLGGLWGWGWQHDEHNPKP